jgi:chorismate mutase/prephenate dehydratase
MARDEPNSAALGSELAGELYDLCKVCDRVEDDPGNVTRFLVVGRDSARPTGSDKTALLFVAADRPGSLVEVLDVFRQRGVNMTFIESRPSRQKKFEYRFFVDIEGHTETAEVTEVIEAARHHCQTLRVLGSFPRADEIV